MKRKNKAYSDKYIKCSAKKTFIGKMPDWGIRKIKNQHKQNKNTFFSFLKTSEKIKNKKTQENSLSKSPGLKDVTILGT